MVFNDVTKTHCQANPSRGRFVCCYSISNTSCRVSMSNFHVTVLWSKYSAREEQNDRLKQLFPSGCGRGRAHVLGTFTCDTLYHQTSLDVSLYGEWISSKNFLILWRVRTSDHQPLDCRPCTHGTLISAQPRRWHQHLPRRVSIRAQCIQTSTELSIGRYPTHHSQCSNSVDV